MGGEWRMLKRRSREGSKQGEGKEGKEGKGVAQ